MTPLRLALAVLSVLCVVSAEAFDGAEHRLISNTGFEVAVEFCKRDPQCRLSNEQQVELVEFASPQSRLNYGILVSSVDYRLNPLQLMQKTGSQNSLPTKASDIDPHLLELLTRGGTAFLRAATSNDTHFQGELMAGIRNWHAYAVDVAAGRPTMRSPDGAPQQAVSQPGNLFGALLINSIGDHFLQDFFAPGHIVTPRFGLHDAVALSIHNRYNTIGAWFEICPTRFRALEQLLAYLKSEPRYKDARFMRGVAELEAGRIPLWGDSELSNSPSEELLMILVEARSVLDVLESASLDQIPINSYRNVWWQPMTRQRAHDDRGDHQCYQLATAELPYGRYVHQPVPVRRAAKAKPPEATYVFALSVGSEMLLGKDFPERRQPKTTTARTVYALEILVGGHLPTAADQHATDASRPSPVHFSEWRQYGLNVGWVHAHNQNETAQGPDLRLVYALPLLHSQLSADVSEKSYAYKDERKRRTAYGLRAESGFSLLQFDLGIAREWTYGVRGLLKPETAVRFGVTLVSPLSNVPGLRKIERGILGRMRRKIENDPNARPACLVKLEPVCSTQ